jgi:hypothetical protein
MNNNTNELLNNNIVKIILSNLYHKQLKREDIKLKNSDLLNNCLDSIHSQTFLKQCLQIDIGEELICTLDYYDILTKIHIFNNKLKVQLKSRLLFFISACYLGNLKIAFLTRSHEFEVYSYSKDTLILTLIKKLDFYRFQQFNLLQNKRIILAATTGQLAMLERKTFDVLYQSIIVNSEVYKFLEINNNRLITANDDRTVRIWHADNLNLIGVITDFGINNVTNLHCITGLKHGNIYSEVEHLEGTINIVRTCGVWNIDDSSHYKELVKGEKDFTYKFCEVGSYLILAKKKAISFLADDLFLEIRLYSSNDYKYIRSVDLGVISDIVCIGDNFIVTKNDNDHSIKLLEVEAFKPIDEVQIDVNTLVTDPKKKVILAEKGRKSIIFKLNK